MSCVAILVSIMLNLNGMAGQPDAHIWFPLGIHRPISITCNELIMVLEDNQGTEEDFGKEAVMVIILTK